MRPKPKPVLKTKLEYFEDKGVNTQKPRLLLAVYYDDTEKAMQIIGNAPEQINMQDPYAGLTPLHVAIFRQNLAVVSALINHPQVNLTLKDNFNRRIVDMLDYTSNREIFKAVIRSVYPEQMQELEDEAYEQGKEDGVIIPLKPKKP